ncbi:Ig-like domain-containing protein [Aeromonas veronii]|uniref:Ig-like domain-containing protein n=1 Tax=Aeromonas veronii TaxID=654 RepID=UPI003B9FE2E4
MCAVYTKNLGAKALIFFYSLSTVSPTLMAFENIKNTPNLRLYQISIGDTAHSIAMSHGIDVATLQRLNPAWREETNGNPNKLVVGQLLAVPFQPEEPNTNQPFINVSNPDSRLVADNNKTELFIAQQGARLGQAYGLHDEKVGDTRYSANRLNSGESSFMQQETAYLKQQVQATFQKEANDQVKKLLGGVGTAEVALAFDEQFGLREYSADLLAPLFETPEQLMFVQAGGRHNDNTERTIVNIGIGQRHFYDSWMLGYNAFWDYDILRHHTRIGLGAEAWADYLKLSANVYNPLSDWKSSPDFVDHLERAARGVDLNATYYLPNYPHLGLSAKVEQYFGDKVDLAGNNQLERNPYAGTVGLEWQPVPLIKLGLEHRVIKGVQSDTQANVGFEWALGASLDEQLNPANVALSRQLQGMRYDLVERNNNIVLEYKEKERVVSIEHAAIEGMSGEQVRLNPSVVISGGQIVAKRWSSPDSLLQAALSELNTEQSMLTLPTLPLEVSTQQTFTLYLTVTDDRGRTYQSGSIPVVVRVNPQMLVNRLKVISEGHEADSIDQQEAEVSVQKEGTVVEFILAREIESEPSAQVIVKPSEVMIAPVEGYVIEQLEGQLRNVARNAETIWVNALKITPSNTSIGAKSPVLSISARGPSGATSGKVHLTLNHGDKVSQTTLSTLIVTSEAPADGSSPNQVTATVTDTEGNPVPNAEVSFATTGSAVLSAQTGMTDAQGQVVITLTSTKAETVTVTATHAGQSMTADSRFVADGSTATVSALVATTDAVANGVASNSVTATVTDATGNPIANAEVSFATTGSAVLSAQTGMTDAQGQVVITLTSTKAETVTVTATHAGQNMTADSRFVADGSTATVSALVATTDAVANGVASNDVTATVTDAEGNPVPNAEVSFATTGSAVLSAQTGMTDAQGQVVITLTSTKAETVTVTATHAGQNMTADSRFVADGSTATVSALVATTDAVANGVASNSVTATVTDANGNPIANAEVSFATTGSAVLSAQTGMTDAQGQVVITLTSTKAETVTVTATHAGQSMTADSRFVADAANPVLSTVSATVNNALANGVATNTLSALVIDHNGNPIPGVEINFYEESPTGELSATKAITNEEGKAIVTMTNTKAEVVRVQVALDFIIKGIDSQFVADAATATVSALVATTNAVADGVASNSVTATVTDANGNPIANAEVSFATTGSAVLSAQTGMTDAQGQVVITLTSTKAETVTVTATHAGQSMTADARFVADSSTAALSALAATTDAVANGVASNDVTATVIDANGNPVANAEVTFAVTGNAVLSATVATTDATGKAVVQLTNEVSETVTITVNYLSGELTTTTFFNGDAATATIDASAVVVLRDNAIANGNFGQRAASNSAKVILRDVRGNLVRGANIDFAITGSASFDVSSVVNTTTVTTDNNGEASVMLTSVVPETIQLTATYRGQNVATPLTFIWEERENLSVGGKTYMLPRDYHHDVAEGFTPNTYSTDKAPHGSTGTRIGLFTMNDAVAYCSAKGGRLPTTSEIREVYTAIGDFKSAGLPSYWAYWTHYSSGTAYPSYIMRDGGGYITVSMNGTATRYVMCVAP